MMALLRQYKWLTFRWCARSPNPILIGQRIPSLKK